MSVKEAVRWNVKVSKETDVSLRSFLSSRGMKKGDFSRFVERAVASSVFQRRVEDIHARNRTADPVEVGLEIEEALREVRAERRQKPTLRR